MGKGIAAGILIALVAGAAVGYFLLPMVFPIQAADERQTYFIISRTSSYDPSGSLTDIPGLTINLSLQTGDSLELFFNCYLGWTPSAPPSGQQAQFVFAIDGVPVSDNYWIYDYTTLGIPYTYAVAYRYVSMGLSPGAHNVTIQVQVTGSFSSVAVDSNVLSVLIL